MRLRIAWIVGLLLTLVAGPAHAQATGTLSEAVNDLAKDVKKYLDSAGKYKLTVGQFPGRGGLARLSSAGPLLQTALERRLKELGVAIVDAKGDFELLGEFEDYEDTVTRRQFVQIKLELRPRQGASKFFVGIETDNGKDKATKYFVKNEADLAKILGPSVYIPPETPTEGRIDQYKDAVDHPETLIDGTRVLAGKDKKGNKAPFALEILTAAPKPGGKGHVDTDYQVRQPKAAEKGLAFVPIARDNVYGVRFLNDADFDVAVDLRIDGLSMFHSSEIKNDKGAPTYKYVIIPKKSSGVVRGWFVNLLKTDEFLVTEYAKSEAGKIGQSAKVGTITATFHAAWDRAKGKPPADEPKNADEFSQSADATGRGDRIDQKYQVVDYQIGVFRAAVSVRYSKD